MNTKHVLLCWHSERAGEEVLSNAVKKLESRLSVEIGGIILLQQENRALILEKKLEEKVTPVVLALSDPTAHSDIYKKIIDILLPKLSGVETLHVNISPGTPAMHAVWLILHAGGRFPTNTNVWSTQWNPKTKRTSLKKVIFPITTYLSEVRSLSNSDPSLAVYDVEANSPARIEGFELLKRFTSVPNIPLLVLGERGTGKTRVIETLVKVLKQKEIVTVACGGLDSTVAESLIFGHRKGSFTGAIDDREGLLSIANGKILFLDEIQDLPQSVQRKLVRVLQDTKHRFRSIGGDNEEVSDFELICASNKDYQELQGLLDQDFLDRISMLKVTLPPLRSCREDLQQDWQKVWTELSPGPPFPIKAPSNKYLKKLLETESLLGNLRDLQKMAAIILAYWDETNSDASIHKGISLWKKEQKEFEEEITQVGKGTSRETYLKRYRKKLALVAKETYGNWEVAGREMGCSSRTLRDDSKL